MECDICRMTALLEINAVVCCTFLVRYQPGYGVSPDISCLEIGFDCQCCGFHFSGMIKSPDN